MLGKETTTLLTAMKYITHTCNQHEEKAVQDSIVLLIQIDVVFQFYPRFMIMSLKQRGQKLNQG